MANDLLYVLITSIAAGFGFSIGIGLALFVGDVASWLISIAKLLKS